MNLENFNVVSLRVMKILCVIIAVITFTFLAPAVWATKASAETRFEPLRIEFADPTRKMFFLEFGAMISDGFRMNHGVHDEGVGGFIEVSYPIFDGKVAALRPAIELAALYSFDHRVNFNNAQGGIDRLKIDVLDFSGHGVIYVDFKERWRLQPYIGIGVGYNYVLEDRSDKVDGEGGGAVVVGHAGIGWQIQKKGRWWLTLGYSYVYSFEDRYFETRALVGKGKINVSNHRVRIGARFGF